MSQFNNVIKLTHDIIYVGTCYSTIKFFLTNHFFSSFNRHNGQQNLTQLKMES